MLLDPVELPVATMRTQKPRLSLLAHGIADWIRARAAWLRARTVPVIVACIGALCVMASGHYLKQLANGPVPAAFVPQADVHYQGMDQSAPRHRHHSPQHE